MNLRKLTALLIVMVMVLSMAACSTTNEQPPAGDSGNSGSSTPSDDTNTPKDDTPQSEEPKNDGEAALEDKLVIYSTHSEDMLEFVADAFTEKTGVPVEFINLKGELADRVRAEKDNPSADIMFGGASSLFMDMAEEGLFAEVETTWASEMDPMFKDSKGAWYGTIQTPVLMFYNSEMLTAEEAPKDWKDLADEKYKDMIVSRDTVSSSIRSTIVSLIYQYEKDGNIEGAWEFLKGLDANMKNYYNSGTLQFQAVGRKEAAISFAVQSAIIDNINDNNMPLEIVDAESGSPVITDGIAAINNAPHPNAAKAFVEFAGGAEMQAKIANEFNRIPTLKSALGDSPEWMSKQYKAMDVDWAHIAANESEWLQKFDMEIRDAAKDIK